MSVSTETDGNPRGLHRKSRKGSARRPAANVSSTSALTPASASESSSGVEPSGDGRTATEGEANSRTNRQTAPRESSSTTTKGLDATTKDQDRRTKDKNRGKNAEAWSRRGKSATDVHPAMLESEFLEGSRQSESGVEGAVASLSLEEVPYDRDLRWCNTASDSRPRPTIDTTGGVFGRLGSNITSNTGDYERLDRHYQELWKDRPSENTPLNGARGRNRPNGRGKASKTANSGRGQHRGGKSEASGRGYGGGRRGKGAQSRSPAAQPDSQENEQASSDQRNGQVEATNRTSNRERKKAQKGKGNQHAGKASTGTSKSAGSVSKPAPAPSSAQAHVLASYRNEEHARQLRHRHAIVTERGVMQPASAAVGRRLWGGMQAREQGPDFVSRDVWMGEAMGCSFAPQVATLPLGAETGAHLLAPPPMATAGVVATPLLLPTPPAFMPQYVGDLARSIHDQSPSDYSPSVANMGPAHGSARTLLDVTKEERSEGFDEEPTQSTSSLTPSKEATVELELDLSLDVDIQDICVDPDLNADAPAFVPGAYFPG